MRPAPEPLLFAIGLARLGKALVCVALTLGVLTRAGEGSSWLAHLALRAARLAHLDDLDLDAMGVVAAAYAAIYFTEAYGLLRARPWGERLALWATSGFIPVELWMLARHPGPGPLVALLANAAIVAYLLWRARRRQAAV